MLLGKEPFCKTLFKVKHSVLKLNLLDINMGENKKNIISKCNVKQVDTALTPEKPEGRYS